FAAFVAEGMRHVIGVDAHGATAAAWQMILVAAPISCAVVAGSRGQASAVDALRRGGALAGVSLLMMIAAMTPLFVRTADPAGRRQRLASGPRPQQQTTTTTVASAPTTETTVAPHHSTTTTPPATSRPSSRGVPTAIVLRPGQVALPPVTPAPTTTGGTPSTPVVPVVPVVNPTPTTPSPTPTPTPTPTTTVVKPVP